MRALRRLGKRFLASLTRNLQEDRARAELQDHLEWQTEDNVRAGMDPAEARRQAVLKFGSPAAWQEHYRSTVGLPWLEALFYDVRHASRRLWHAPVFTGATVLTVALGMGATTSIFTLSYAVLLQSLHVAKPSELLRLGRTANCCYQDAYAQNPEASLVSYSFYAYARDNTPNIEALAACSATTMSYGIRQQGSPASAYVDGGKLISGNYFSMFGLSAAAGRLIRPSDDRLDATPVAVMSYQLWQHRYHKNPHVVGSIFYFSGKPVTVVGITPESFFGESLSATPPDFYLPLGTGDLGPDRTSDSPGTAWLQVLGRIRPGAHIRQIEATMRVELRQWLRSHWGDMNAVQRALSERQTLYLAPGGSGITAMRDQYERWLHILLLVSAFVLIIVCANVANLMLVRGSERQRQSAISIALGASPFTLVRQAFVESVLLSLSGGCLGLLLAFAATSLVLQYIFPHVGDFASVPISPLPSLPVLVVSFLTAFLSGLGFGIAPAYMATRVDAIESLRGANRSTSRSGTLPRKLLVVAQSALCLTLLASSGLLTGTLTKLQGQQLGFESKNRTVISFDPRLAGYEPSQLDSLYPRISEALRRVPGVQSAALCVYSPLSGNAWGSNIWVEAHSTPGPNDDSEAFWNRITPGYRDAVGSRIIRGRDIDERDSVSSSHVAVINQAFAHHFFPNADPIGHYFGLANDSSNRFRIVGLVEDTRYLTFDLDKPIQPFYFLSEPQHDFDGTTKQEISPGSHYMQNIVIRSYTGATVSDLDLRRALASVDSRLPIMFIRPLSYQADMVFRPTRLIARITSSFSLLALLLSSLGLYGIAAYTVTQRTPEIGVRIALGATGRHAAKLVLAGPFALILIGLSIGLPLSLLTAHILTTQVAGLVSFDARSLAFAIGLLALCGFIASLIPALRASRIAPIEALRSE